MAGVAVERYTGNDDDYSGYTGADALHQSIAVGGVEMQSADERVMTGIENNIEHSENVALAKGKKAIIEKMNANEDESAAQTAMQEAIDDYYTTIQKNIYDHLTAQQDQLFHMVEQVSTHDNIGVGSVFHLGTEDGNISFYTPFTRSGDHWEESLLNGETYGLDAIHVEGGQYGGSSSGAPANLGLNDTRSDEADETCYVFVIDPDDGTNRLVIDFTRYSAALSEVSARRDSVNADLSGFVSDVYSQYAPGDIPTEDIVDPITAATELRQDYDNASGQSAHAAMLGIPTTAELSADLEIKSDEASDGVWEVDADLFTAHVPREDVTSSASFSSGVLTISTEPVSGETYTLTTAAGETIDIAAGDFTDNGDGTWKYDASAGLSTTSTSVDTLLGEEIGFQTGNTYQPSTWSDPFYVAYNYVDEQTGEKKGAFTQIESETKIVEVTDSNGDSVDNFKTESRNNQTADVAALKEELEQLREEQIRLQEEAQEKNDDDGPGPIFGGGDWLEGGGGGMLGLGIIGVVILAVVGIVSDALPGN